MSAAPAPPAKKNEPSAAIICDGASHFVEIRDGGETVAKVPVSEAIKSGLDRLVPHQIQNVKVLARGKFIVVRLLRVTSYGERYEGPVDHMCLLEVETGRWRWWAARNWAMFIFVGNGSLAVVNTGELVGCIELAELVGGADPRLFAGRVSYSSCHPVEGSPNIFAYVEHPQGYRPYLFTAEGARLLARRHVELFDKKATVKLQGEKELPDGAFAAASCVESFHVQGPGILKQLCESAVGATVVYNKAPYAIWFYAPVDHPSD